MSAPAKWPYYTEPQRLDVRGLPVAYRRAGSGQPVLYLHGAGLTGRWLPFHEELARHVDLVAPEHPGFGETPRTSWAEGMDDLVLHYADVLDALNLRRVHLVGHSLGGWLAAEFATYFPERLLSLQLIAPAGLEDAFRDVSGSPAQALERVFNGRSADFSTYVYEGVEAEAIARLSAERRAAQMLIGDGFAPKLRRRLCRIATSTQVVLAEEDRVLENEVVRQYAAEIPGAQLNVIHGDPVPTSHVPFVQAPTALAQLLADFIHTHRQELGQ